MSVDEEIDVISAVELSQNQFCCPVNGKTILSDLLLTFFGSMILGVHQINLDNFKLFILSVQELLCYVAPRQIKFKDKSCMLPYQLIQFCGLNNPKNMAIH